MKLRPQAYAHLVKVASFQEEPCLLPPRSDYLLWIRSAVVEAGVFQPVSLTLAAVTNEHIRALNHRFRGKDAATNVLSFGEDPLAFKAPRRFLGEVLCAPDYLKEEAQSLGRPLREHWAHMVIHGVLHLLGFDHEVEDEAIEMEAKERAILEILGF